MTGNIDIKVDDGEVRKLLERLSRKASDMDPAMKEVGELIRTSVVTNFEMGGRYSEPGSWRGGTKTWQPLSLATLFAGKKGKFVGKRGKFRKGAEERLRNRRTLIREGHLMDSITYKASGTGVLIGTNKEYAAIHNFGGQAGRGKKVKVPARPFLVVQDEDLEEIKRVLLRHLAGG